MFSDFDLHCMCGCICMCVYVSVCVFALLPMAVHMAALHCFAWLTGTLIFSLTLQSNVASFKVSTSLNVHSGGGGGGH